MVRISEMSKHAASALRPRSKFYYKGERHIVIFNDTLERVLHVRQLGHQQTLRLRYQPETEITCYWVPFNQR